MATATEPTVEEEELTEEEVETPVGEDEPLEPEAPAEEAETGETVEEFQKRFTQFRGETPEEYAKNLEDAYGHSTTEATRLSQENKSLQQRLDSITAVVANNPEVAAQLNGQPSTQTGSIPPSPMMDPILSYARQNIQQQWENEYHEFVNEHPEMQTDQVRNKQVLDTLQTLSVTMQQTQGRQPGMKEGLRMAWSTLGLDDNEEATRMAVKNSAAQSKAPVGRPTSSPQKPQFTQDQLEFAQRAYPDKTEEELTELLSQHINN